MNLLFLALAFSLAGCTGRTDDGTVTVKVKMVEQVENYTYMLVKGKGPAYWVASPTMEITPGESITYQGGLLMENFPSKELDRTFDRVLFIDAGAGDTPAVSEMMGGTTQGSAVKTPKLETAVEAEEGIVTLAELFANPGQYEGKSIQVKGEVAKFNGGIMNRNWIHIQDGTEYEGKYDLTVTSQESFEVGQQVTVEGVLALNMDFGYGYSYELLLEAATKAK